ncbi:tyrosine-protein kinase SYK-like isoform X1 [Tubulanus polymorphus]|uniref:tyrosine-protein kinase SYK-like isoform X1 n=1 Tax=Tubulanus polymorphus TaxID=672921 RepID=UPI003DA4D0E7
MSGYSPLDRRTTCSELSAVPYFWGRIAREDAEELFNAVGACKGLFLLRESMSVFGAYVLTLCDASSAILHFKVERTDDGFMSIPNGMKFIDPIQMVDYYGETPIGLPAKLQFPCCRNAETYPMAFRGITMATMEAMVREKLKRNGVPKQDIEVVMEAQRDQSFQAVAKDLHTKMSWFHGKIDRNEAEKRIKKTGIVEGKFIIRHSREENSFRLSLCDGKEIFHYIINHNENGTYSLPNGSEHKSIMAFVDNYFGIIGGLRTKFTVPCADPNKRDDQWNNDYRFRLHTEEGSVYRPLFDQVGRYPSTPSTPDSMPPCEVPPLPIDPRPLVGSRRPSAPLPLTPPPTEQLNHRRRSSSQRDGACALEPPPPASARRRQMNGHHSNNSSLLDESNPTAPGLQAPIHPRELHNSADLEKIYEKVPRNDETFDLSRNDLVLQETLGSGNFGDVVKGIYITRGRKEIPVAVKTLKNDSEADKQSLLKEAKIMQGLNHRHVIRLIGICNAEQFMLVMELAPYGQLNRYLKNQRKQGSLTQHELVTLVYEVAMGMEYLESVNFVHRDLAARNVLLANPQFVKISDFGMSRALNLDEDYYKANANSRWPLKWYAPECLFYHRFSTKSDVWSFGVTMWETFSYGAKPYKGVVGPQLAQLLQDNKRLEKPKECSDALYEVMWNCWKYESADRPSFKDLVVILQKFVEFSEI